MEGFPSGQRGQTVNLLHLASMVRIHLPPPRWNELRSFLFFAEKTVTRSAVPFFPRKTEGFAGAPAHAGWNGRYLNCSIFPRQNGLCSVPIFVAHKSITFHIAEGNLARGFFYFVHGRPDTGPG